MSFTISSDPLFTNSEIQEAIIKVANKISTDYAEKSPLIIGVLKGATIFLGQLVPRLTCDCEIDFVQVSSYRDQTKSQSLQFLLDIEPSKIKNRDIIILEDIIDSGKTVKFLINHLQKSEPKSIKVATLINKIITKHNLDIDYSAILYNGENFIVGFGFDLNEKYRNLPAIYALIS